MQESRVILSTFSEALHTSQLVTGLSVAGNRLLAGLPANVPTFSGNVSATVSGSRAFSSSSRRALLLNHARQPFNLVTARGFASSDMGYGYLMPRRTPPNPGFVVVSQQEAYVLERLGKFHKVLSPGLHFCIPVIDQIAYVFSLKETAIPVPNQSAVTKDNVSIQIDGVLYYKVVDPVKASYGVDNAVYAIVQLAQTTMRSEIGKISLDKTFEEREKLNHNIINSINSAAESWGLQCLRYEIRDINPPAAIKHAMELQAEAERRKRAQILESEGEKEAKINRAEGEKAFVILNSEANREEQVNRAKGEAEAIRQKAQATSEAIKLLADQLTANGGKEAVSLRVAEQYIAAFSNLAKTSTTLLLPANAAEPSAMVAQAMSIFNATNKAQGDAGSARGGSGAAASVGGKGNPVLSK